MRSTVVFLQIAGAGINESPNSTCTFWHGRFCFQHQMRHSKDPLTRGGSLNDSAGVFNTPLRNPSRCNLPLYAHTTHTTPESGVLVRPGKENCTRPGAPDKLRAEAQFHARSWGKGQALVGQRTRGRVATQKGRCDGTTRIRPCHAESTRERQSKQTIKCRLVLRAMKGAAESPVRACLLLV
jgi:hypothetical protein